MISIDDILKGPGYFFCETTHCRMKIDTCLQRQKANLSKHPNKPIPFWQCQNCSQGAENMHLKEIGANMSSENPSEGSGSKNLDCENYERCLDIASEKDWGAFNCEGCGHFNIEKKGVPGATNANDKRLCKKCEKNPVINKLAHVCSACMNEARWQKKAAAKAKGEDVSKAGTKTKRRRGRPPKKRHPSMDEPEKVQKTENSAVTIDFGKYIYIYRKIEELADQEMRPVDLQIAYMLKKQLEISGGA